MTKIKSDPSNYDNSSLTLETKYTATSGRIFVTGTQALVRLPMMQRQRDLANELRYRRIYFRLSGFTGRRLRFGAMAGFESS